MEKGCKMAAGGYLQKLQIRTKKHTFSVRNESGFYCIKTIRYAQGASGTYIYMVFTSIGE